VIVVDSGLVAGLKRHRTHRTGIALTFSDASEGVNGEIVTPGSGASFLTAVADFAARVDINDLSAAYAATNVVGQRVRSLVVKVNQVLALGC
jgi:hypothetical protein